MRSLMSGAVGLLLVAASALAAQTVQFGSTTAPTTGGSIQPFSISNGYGSGQVPPIPPQHLTYSYPAEVFAAAIQGYSYQISTFRFFHNFPNTNWSTNGYNVFMGAGGGPLSLFGQFASFGPALIAGMFVPAGAGGLGSYLYDPDLGDLRIEMIQTADMAVSIPQLLWYTDEYSPGGQRGLVTQFTGSVVTPEPSTLLLMGTGLLIVAGLARRRRETPP